MYEIYREYLDNFPSGDKKQNLEFHNRTITQQEISDFIKTLHFGREGKLYFPSSDSKESKIIEKKLTMLGLVGDSGSEGQRANLQISTYGLGGYITPHYDTYTQPGEDRVQVRGSSGLNMYSVLITLVVFDNIFIINYLQSGEDWAGTVMGYLTTLGPHQGGHTVFPR